MTAKASTARSVYGMICVQCGDDLIAPELSECVGERYIRHLWHCSSCGCQSEETTYFCADAGPTRGHKRRHAVSAAAAA